MVSFLVPEGDIFDQKNLILNTDNIRDIDEKQILQKYNLSNSLIVLIDLDTKKITYNMSLIYLAFLITKRLTKSLKMMKIKNLSF